MKAYIEQPTKTTIIEVLLVVFGLCMFGAGMKYITDRNHTLECNNQGKVVRVIDGIKQCVAPSMVLITKGDK